MKRGITKQTNYINTILRNVAYFLHAILFNPLIDKSYCSKRSYMVLRLVSQK